jgi:error-prone DNA polymerase
LKRTLGVPLFQEQLLRMAMTLAGFTGGEAEELRRAMGFKRSVERMQQIEARLRAGMAKRGITGKTADDIVRSITSFALYGFPESHAASFALLAYASAYLRAHHRAAFTCALLNNWPMGFYHPATLVKDAQRHGLRVLPIDVTRSGWKCTLERQVSGAGCQVSGLRSRPPIPALCPLAPDTRHLAPGSSLRLGLRYVAGLREDAGKRIEGERAQAPFTSIADVARRCQLRDNEMQTLAHIGAFAAFGLTRREALWQAAAVPREPLFKLLGCYGVRLLGDIDNATTNNLTTNNLTTNNLQSPLPAMSALERTLADYKGTGMTVGPHVVKHLREALVRHGALRAIDLKNARDGSWAKVAGLVIVRQRPGTAKGFCFITLEDETGTANAVVVPTVFQQYRSVIHTAAFLLVEGPLQKVDGVIHVRARRIQALALSQQPIGLTGGGYRMRVSPQDEEPPPTPKSHDFR